MIKYVSRGILAAFVVVLPVSIASDAAGDEWKALYAASQGAFKQGNLGAAAELMGRAIVEAEKAGSIMPEVARSIVDLSDACLERGLLAEAGLLLERTRGALAGLPGDQASEFPRIYYNLSQFKASRENYAEAESILGQVLAAQEKKLGPDHIDVAGTLDRLSDLKFAQKDYIAAEDLKQRALQIWANSPGTGPLDAAKALKVLAAFSAFRKEYDKADSLRRRALSLQEKELGMHHPEVAETLVCLAATHLEDGRRVTTPGELAEIDPIKADAGFRIAEPLLKRALAIRETDLGPDHPDTIRVIELLIEGYSLHGDDPRVKPYLEKLLSRRARMLGEDHPDVIKLLIRIANITIEQHNYNEAIPTLKRLFTAKFMRDEAGYRDEGTILPPLGDPLPRLTLARPGEQKVDLEDSASQLRKALRRRESLENPSLWPTTDDLNFIKSHKWNDAVNSIVDLMTLRSLTIQAQSIDPDELIHIRGLISLESLRLNPSPMAEARSTPLDSGLIYLKKLTSLSHLSLSGCAIRGQGLACLADLTELKSLDLNFTLIDDAGLKHLPLNLSLQELKLQGTRVTDDSVPKLKRMANLRSINLLGTRVTEAAADELRRSRPSAQISGPLPPLPPQ